jgi:signal peptidase I
VGQPARSDRKPLQEAPPGAPGAQPSPQKTVAREYGEALGIALVLAIIIRTFFIQAYKIPSGSMEPTLLVGDHILVNKIVYGLRMPDSIFGVQLIPGIPPRISSSASSGCPAIPFRSKTATSGSTAAA